MFKHKIFSSCIDGKDITVFRGCVSTIIEIGRKRLNMEIDFTPSGMYSDGESVVFVGYSGEKITNPAILTIAMNLTQSSYEIIHRKGMLTSVIKKDDTLWVSGTIEVEPVIYRKDREGVKYLIIGEKGCITKLTSEGDFVKGYGNVDGKKVEVTINVLDVDNFKIKELKGD